MSLSKKEIKQLKKLFEKYPLPWSWNDVGAGPQLQANYPNSLERGMSPILLAHGCDSNDGVGCFPEGINGDEMRTCPLHPEKDIRNFLADAPMLIMKLLEEKE